MVLALDDTINHGALEIKDTKNVRGTSHGVLHHDKFNGLLVLHSHRVDTVDSGKETVVMARDVGKVWLLNALEGVEVTVSHGLDNELLISREEEKAATLTLRLTSFKDHLTVGSGVERLFQDRVVVAILLAKESKDVRSVLSDLDIFIDHQQVLLSFSHSVTLCGR